MQDLSGKVVVITGAGSGIGFGLAQEAARRGMRVVLSDIREDALAHAAEKLSASGATVLTCQTDVTQPAELERLCTTTIAHFGAVNMLVNNAGAFVAGLSWEMPAVQYDWIIDLNLKSIIHGIRSFVPRMIAQGDPCHVVTIASGAAISVYPGYAAYSATKHAALAVAEALHHDLLAEGIENIGVTIVMPGAIRTNIMTPEKTSPAALDLAKRGRFENKTVRMVERMTGNSVENAILPEELARQVFDAVVAGKLYVLPNHDSEALQTLGKTIAIGRATGVNAYGPYLEIMLQMMAETETGKKTTEF